MRNLVNIKCWQARRTDANPYAFPHDSVDGEAPLKSPMVYLAKFSVGISSDQATPLLTLHLRNAYVAPTGHLQNNVWQH